MRQPGSESFDPGLLHSHLDLVDWSEIGRAGVEAVLSAHRVHSAHSVHSAAAHLELDCDLAIDLPFVLADPHVARELGLRLVRRAVEVVGEDWGAVTIGSGVLGLGRSPLARVSRYAGLSSRHYAYLEVHSTGPAVGPLSSGFAHDPFGARGYGPLEPEKAQALLHEFNGELIVDPLATAGVSVLLLLPYAAADVFP